ncbi:Hypothetical predicted protein [Olea europaea subsp. europaea]|uniref:Uncharacterized protein n=1 Tax=Olea europaea subsp. europaea TaxID=158383 RepID=A0A8S0SWG3_OLEEU|nr:Hypothetical predicted protein [Olea europaea subsp. europaea]
MGNLLDVACMDWHWIGKWKGAASCFLCLNFVTSDQTNGLRALRPPVIGSHRFSPTTAHFCISLMSRYLSSQRVQIEFARYDDDNGRACEILDNDDANEMTMPHENSRKTR